jgi:DNA-binding LytR/AlgR family response regulator
MNSSPASIEAAAWVQRTPATTDGLRVLIAASDPELRTGLERLCHENGLQTLPGADTGAFALQLARMLSPDLVLVDSELSDMTGLQVLEELRADNLAGVVVTAQALARARVWLSAAAIRGRPGSNHPVLVGERQRRLYLLDPGRIDYVEAEGNYVIFHAASDAYLSRDTLKRLDLTLQAYGFLRIENSLLLNIAAIDYAVPFGRGRFVFTLRSGMTLRSTLTYRADILKRLPLARRRR